jgi:hypothetical protein
MRSLAFLLLAGCSSITYAPSPPVFDAPADHTDDTWLFADRINRIDLNVDDPAADILSAARMLSKPRD